jgi:protein-export membrane protein SecD
LGANVLKSSIIVGAIGIAVIFVLMILLYGLSGLASSLALSLYILNLLFFYAVFPWVQLTLSGIAGVLVSIGMAVDANIVIFERAKDEYRLGKNKLVATRVGFKKSLSAILDGNITTIIGVIVIWIFGAATIKGFATTLFVGIILSMLAALLLTRLIIYCFYAFNLKDSAFGYAKVGDDGAEEVAHEQA